MCRKSSVIKGSPILQAHFFMPSEQQPFPDFIENQKKDVTGILIISGQSTSTVSNSTDTPFCQRSIQKGWKGTGTRRPTYGFKTSSSKHTQEERFGMLMEYLREYTFITRQEYPVLFISYDRFHRKELLPRSPKCLCSPSCMPQGITILMPAPWGSFISFLHPPAVKTFQRTSVIAFVCHGNHKGLGSKGVGLFTVTRISHSETSSIIGRNRLMVLANIALKALEARKTLHKMKGISLP